MPPRPDRHRMSAPPTNPAQRPRRPRIRGFAAREREQDIGLRMEALKVFTAGAPAAALRAVRRAALTGIGYDPVRHAALCRLARGRTYP
ncbi:hypothetical protein DFO45_3469 [Azorhizobium sp. AG788]|uniref:hypothetical protein n=1 Tax=Azorhizobium sp. AG788 TaxID=2183897 RepID=UPI0010E1A8B6|nr:hypothetical protein [Azorhizobium sp. AG788]TDT92708.1 hypothetical protein DFO45_3469 [Azorhizobium sp. AG788]